MGYKVSREAFLEMLGRVAPGISKKGTIEQSSCFVFQDGWCNTFNDEICCRTQSGLPDDITGAVHAETLTKWLEAVNEDEVEVWTEDKTFRLRAGRKKAGIRMESEIVLPVDEVTLPETWIPLPPDFAQAVDQVRGTAASNNEEFLTRCIHIHPDYLEACDRKQATRYMVPTGVTESFLVLASTLAHTVQLELTKMGETGDWVHFRNKSLIFSCRRHLEDYPTDNITKMLAFRGERAVLPRGAEIAAKLGAVFTGEEGDMSRVTVKLTDGHMVVRGEGSRGWTSDDLDMTYAGDDVVFRVSPHQLTQLVKNSTDCEIAPGRLRVTGERWTYLTVLGKPTDETTEPQPVTVGAGEADEDDDGDDN